MISESLETFGLTGTLLVQRKFGRPCHSCGIATPLIVCASATRVMVQSPGDVSE